MRAQYMFRDNGCHFRGIFLHFEVCLGDIRRRPFHPSPVPTSDTSTDRTDDRQCTTWVPTPCLCHTESACDRARSEKDIGYRNRLSRYVQLMRDKANKLHTYRFYTVRFRSFAMSIVDAHSRPVSSAARRNDPLVLGCGPYITECQVN